MVRRSARQAAERKAQLQAAAEMASQQVVAATEEKGHRAAKRSKKRSKKRVRPKSISKPQVAQAGSRAQEGQGVPATLDEPPVDESEAHRKQADVGEDKDANVGQDGAGVGKLVEAGEGSFSYSPLDTLSMMAAVEAREKQGEAEQTPIRARLSQLEEIGDSSSSSEIRLLSSTLTKLQDQVRQDVREIRNPGQDDNQTHDDEDSDLGSPTPIAMEALLEAARLSQQDLDDDPSAEETREAAARQSRAAKKRKMARDMQAAALKELHQMMKHHGLKVRPLPDQKSDIIPATHYDLQLESDTRYLELRTTTLAPTPTMDEHCPHLHEGSREVNAVSRKHSPARLPASNGANAPSTAAHLVTVSAPNLTLLSNVSGNRAYLTNYGPPNAPYHSGFRGGYGTYSGPSTAGAQYYPGYLYPQHPPSDYPPYGLPYSYHNAHPTGAAHGHKRKASGHSTGRLPNHKRPRTQHALPGRPQWRPPTDQLAPYQPPIPYRHRHPVHAPTPQYPQGYDDFGHPLTWLR